VINETPRREAISGIAKTWNPLSGAGGGRKESTDRRSGTIERQYARVAQAFH